VKNVFVWYIIGAVSLLLFILMGADKHKAKNHKRRIPEKTLFLLALMGGAVGGTIGMYLFRHKTKHWYFAVFFPLLALIQLIAAFYLTIF